MDSHVINGYEQNVFLFSKQYLRLRKVIKILKF